MSFTEHFGAARIVFNAPASRWFVPGLPTQDEGTRRVGWVLAVVMRARDERAFMPMRIPVLH